MIFHKKVEAIYKSQLFTRYDDNGFLKYFSYTDFDGMRCEPYEFKSSKVHKLFGAFYSYEGCSEHKLVIFEHGLGGGHLSYMKEIERLCRAGYRVFAYDHTGCMSSEGENVGGFSQAVADLDDCIKALRADESIELDDIFVVGHSFGGFATLCITALCPEVKKIVSFSAPISISSMLEQNFRGIFKCYRKGIMALERASNPDYADLDARECLKKSDVKALIYYSDNDPIVKKEYHYDSLRTALTGKVNIKFVLEVDKGHNPNYTCVAAEYVAELGEAVKFAQKNLKSEEDREAFRNAFDWNKMTEQDNAVWEEIIKFLR